MGEIRFQLSFILLIFSAIVVWNAGFSIAAEKVATTEIKFPIDCKPYHMRSMKILLKNFNKCSRQLKANVTTDKEYEENIGCAMKCTMRATGYSENDIVTEASMRRAAKTLLPDGLVDPVIKILHEQCQSKFGPMLKPEEPQCKAYSDYAFCIQNCIGDLLENPLYCIREEKKKS